MLNQYWHREYTLDRLVRVIQDLRASALLRPAMLPVPRQVSVDIEMLGVECFVDGLVFRYCKESLDRGLRGVLGFHGRFNTHSAFTADKNAALDGIF